MKPSSHDLAATERRNPRSQRLDQLTTRELLQTINREDQLVAGAVRAELGTIAQAVTAIVQTIDRGGRLIYVGAGTSGRLAALDAAECPPTFGVPSGLVQAVIAGGRRALTRASEDVEDSVLQGGRDLAARKVSVRDAVVGVTASGGTPYVLGALRYARKRGAMTIAITSNRRSPAARIAKIAIAPQTGAEVIAGSTRMKAGTAQKLILNMLSTAAMVQLGRVYNNWMVDLSMSNEKLRRRGLRILEEATGATPAAAKRALARSGNLRVALLMLETGESVAKARLRLKQSAGNLRHALASHFPKENARKVGKTHVNRRTK